MFALSVNLVETIRTFIITTIEQLGYVGVFAAMLLESAGVPLPSEVIMPFAGYVAWEGKLTLIGVTIAGTLGCLVGSLVLYVIGVYGGRPLLDRYGKYVLIRKSELDRADRWFAKYGEMTVFASRMLPVVRSFFSLPAGMTHMNIARFSVYTTLGSFLWCLALAYVGVLLGPRWSDVVRLLRYFNVAVIIGVIALIGYLIYNRKRIAARMD